MSSSSVNQKTGETEVAEGKTVEVVVTGIAGRVLPEDLRHHRSVLRHLRLRYPRRRGLQPTVRLNPPDYGAGGSEWNRSKIVQAQPLPQLRLRLFFNHPLWNRLFNPPLLLRAAPVQGTLVWDEVRHLRHLSPAARPEVIRRGAGSV